MADFLEEEAIESEDEELSGDEARVIKKRKRGAIDSSEDEEEEDDEEKAREEMKDFIADEDEDEEEEDDRRRRKGGRVKKKKKRSRRRSSGSSRSGSGSRSGSSSSSRSGSGSARSRSRSRSRRRSRTPLGSELDDDDMDLIQENLGVKIQKQRTRIQRMSSDESEDERPRSGASGASDDGDLPDPESRRERSGSVDDSEDDGINDFIVDEEGKPIERKKTRKKHIFNDSQRQLAEDIFGVAFDYEEFEQYEGSGGDTESEEYDEDEDEDEDGQRIRKESKRRRRTAKPIFEIYEPYELEQGHYTDLDQEIRSKDVPERMQLRQVPVTAVPEDSDELDREAEWIFKYGFTKPTISKQIDYTVEDCRAWQERSQTTEKIKKALDFMRQQILDVPFIAFYRKEYISPELDINSLWRVYHMDEKWCQLLTRKKNFRRLLEKMQKYQSDCLLADTNDLPEGIPMIGQEEMDKLDMVETIEEYQDMYSQFMLFHGRQLTACQEFHRDLARKERAERRERRKAGRRKRYKTVTKTVRRKATKTITKTITETVTNDDGEEEEQEKEVEEEIETEVESEVEEEVTDEEAEDNEEDKDDDDSEEEEEEEDPIKYAVKNDFYHLCVKKKLTPLSRMFGLTPEEFGENLQDNYMKNDVQQETREVDEVVAEYFQPNISTKEQLTKAMIYMVAKQIAAEPSVRQAVREVFYERATLSVKPTKKGFVEIGEDHELFTLKYLKDKPVRSLKGEEFLKLMNAKEDKLIEMRFADDIPGTISSQTYLDEAVDLYKYDGFSTTVKEWNELRRSAVEMALKNMIFVDLRRELLNVLKVEAIDGIKMECRLQLRQWIQWAPYSVDLDGMDEDDEDDWDSSGGCRILGISYSNEKDEAAFAALITPEGELADYRKLGNLTNNFRPWDSNERHGPEKMEDLETLKKLIATKRPHAVAICCDRKTAIGLQMDVEEVIDSLVSTGFPRIKVVLVDNNLATVYANTNKSMSDFRDFPTVLKQAISTARRLQDPLVEFSQLCNPENDILCLRYHPSQDVVGEDELLAALSLEFINLVNSVGVDINECVAHPHASNLIQFIGGLGPRKGAALLKTLRSQPVPRLENRQQLVTSCHMGPKVFINCAGFIKIDTSALGDSEQYIEVLDGSRIHNEAYEWARKMAIDALEYDEEEGNGPASAVEDILRQPEKLDELNLDAFAEELERQGFGNKSMTLYDIRMELNEMYKDHRKPFEEPTTDERFEMVTKETPKTFFIGKIVMATVTGFKYKRPPQEELDQAAPDRKNDEEMWECPFCGKNDFPELTEVWNHFDAADDCPGKCTGVTVNLDNSVRGVITLKDLSDSEIRRPEGRVKVGQRIHARITKIFPDKFLVWLTCKTSALRDEDDQYKPERDQYFDFDQATQDKKEYLDKQKKKDTSKYITRVIVHPSFHNVSFKEAEKLLETLDQGEAVIRPSSKGQDHLSVSWKVCDGIYQHIDVKEENKANPFSLGEKLFIENEEFEDLDEIIARYINPMASNARDLLAFKYYRDTAGGDRQHVSELLLAEKKLANNKIHYLITASKQFPGKFMLSYIPREQARHEFVTVTPDGFRFRRQMHESVNQLIKWFKEHFRDPIPGTPMTPGGTRLPGVRTPGGNYVPRMTPGARSTGAAITPGAMSMAGGGITPGAASSYGGGRTPGAGGRHSSAHLAPYTPTANTPFLTPMATPGPSSQNYGATPRGRQEGAVTPRQTSGSRAQVPPSPGGSYRGKGSSAGMDWAAEAKKWMAGKGINIDDRPPSRHQGDKGYSTTPRYDDPRRTPHYGGGGRTPQHNSGARTPMHNSGSRTPVHASGSRTPLHGSSSGARTPMHNSGSRTPQHGGRTPSYGATRTPQYGDRTPQHGARTPQHGARTPGSRTPSYGKPAPPGSERRTPGYSTPGRQPNATPRSTYGDATPLYDE